MTFTTTPINESPVIFMRAGEDLNDVRGRAVKFDENGNAALAKTSDDVLGIALISNDEIILEGESVDVQLRAIGLVKAGAAIVPGDVLTPDENGALVPAESGTYIALALQKAAAADEFVRALITRGVKTDASGA